MIVGVVDVDVGVDLARTKVVENSEILSDKALRNSISEE